MDASQRESDATPNDASPSGPPAPIAVELQQLAERLREVATAPEPLGVCVLAVDPQARCAETTELQCALLAGTWVAGAKCPEEGGVPAENATEPVGPVDEALTQRQARLAVMAPAPPEPLGTCVYAAGNKACSAAMSQLQCDLLGGIWFRSAANAAATGAG